MRQTRVAVIGAGQIARTRHLPNFCAMPEAEVVAVCDANPTAAQTAAQAFHVAWHGTSIPEMLAQTRPDAVSVCVPNCFHFDTVCAALNAGCHVLCEKPPAMNAQQAEQMAALAAKQNLLLSYGFHLRHSASVAKLHQRIADGDLGTIYAAKAQWLRRRGIPGWGNFTNRTMQGGGPLIDIGAHVLDLAFYLLDYPAIRYVCAASSDYIGRLGGIGDLGAWDADRFSVEDCVLGQIFFERGAVLTLETSFALNMPSANLRNVFLYGAKLGAGLFPMEYYDAHGLCAASASPVESADAPEDPYRTEAENFIHACQGQEKLLVTAQQDVYVQRVIDALYRSAESHMPVFMNAAVSGQ